MKFLLAEQIPTLLREVDNVRFSRVEFRAKELKNIVQYKLLKF